MSSLIKNVFLIIGSLVAALLMGIVIFSSTGQQFIWSGIHPVMEDQWNQCTMDNGAERSNIYEEAFTNIKNHVG